MSEIPCEKIPLLDYKVKKLYLVKLGNDLPNKNIDTFASFNFYRPKTYLF